LDNDFHNSNWNISIGILIMKKSTYIMSWIVMIIAFAFIALIGFWDLYPYNPVEFKSPTLEILNCPCEPGQAIEYRVQGQGYGEYPVVISKTLVDGIIFAYPSRHEISIDGHFDFTSKDVEIPEFASNGMYILSTILEFEVNPIRVIRIELASDPFQIISND